MSLTLHRTGPPVTAAVALATSTMTGLAGHWFVAWLLVVAGSALFATWSLRERSRRRRALLDARAELQRITDQQRQMRVDLDQARRDARAVQQEVRADMELLRAEVTVAAEPEDPEDQRP